MKRFLALLLAITVLFSFSGCTAGDIIAKIKNFNIVSVINNEPDWDSITVAEIESGSRLKYYFKQLSNKEKQAYNNILGEIESMPATIEIPSLNQTELSTVFEALLYDNPYLFFLGRSCSITKTGLKSYFNAEYIIPPDEYTIMKRELAEKSNDLMAGLAKKSEFETELFIHDYIVNNCSYQNNGTEDESSAYGALIGKVAACEGYSKAAKVLFDIAGIDCYVINGMSQYQGSSESHMWNIVKINGNYYNLDLTWDDPLTVGQSGKNTPRYTYFNITDEEIKKTHSEFSSVNACTAAADNYFVVKGLFFSEYNEKIDVKIAKGIAAAANEGRKSIEIKFSTSDAYSVAFTELFENEHIYDILSNADSLSKANISNTSIAYIENKDFNIIELIIDFPS